MKAPIVGNCSFKILRIRVPPVAAKGGMAVVVPSSWGQGLVGRRVRRSAYWAGLRLCRSRLNIWFLILYVLDGSGQQAELVALGITQYHPTDVGALTHISSLRAKGEQALELLGSGYAISPEVEMQPVFDDLALGHRYHIDGRPGFVLRRDADDLAILLDNMPAEDGAPEVGHHPRPDCINGNDS
ncbi:MAG: hypothetical protein JWO34_1449 [Arthrobacter sp.]|nr:hypothetical protein [Arthrobacter sp.]